MEMGKKTILKEDGVSTYYLLRLNGNLQFLWGDGTTYSEDNMNEIVQRLGECQGIVAGLEFIDE